MIKRFKVVARTHTGMVRTNNEDNFTVCPDLSFGQWVCENKDVPVSLGSKGALVAVADGMGGTNAGEVASKIAVETLQHFFTKENNVLQPRLLSDALLEANETIIGHAKHHRESEGMGTTCIMAWLHPEGAQIAWVGDSRAYLFVPERGLLPVSKDHSFVQELVDAGKISYDQAFYHPDSNIITQSLGAEKQSLKPGNEFCQLYRGDRLLLCSDGLNGMLTDAEIERIMVETPNIFDCSERLINRANEEGGKDNTTIIICEVTEAAERPATDLAHHQTPINQAIHMAQPRKSSPALVALGWISAFLAVGALGYFGTKYIFPPDKPIKNTLDSLKLTKKPADTTTAQILVPVEKPTEKAAEPAKTPGNKANGAAMPTKPGEAPTKPAEPKPGDGLREIEKSELKDLTPAKPSLPGGLNPVKKQEERTPAKPVEKAENKGIGGRYFIEFGTFPDDPEGAKITICKCFNSQELTDHPVETKNSLVIMTNFSDSKSATELIKENSKCLKKKLKPQKASVKSN